MPDESVVTDDAPIAPVAIAPKGRSLSDVELESARVSLAGKLGDILTGARDSDSEPSDDDSSVVDDITSSTAQNDVEGDGDSPPAYRVTSATGPSLPDAYKRSLKAYGWADDEIQENLKSFGHKFIETASRIHQNRVSETQNWANAGRAAKSRLQSQTDNTVVPAASPAPAAGSPKQSSLKKIDVEALKAKYGDDRLIDEIAIPHNDTVDKLEPILAQLKQYTDRQQREQEEQFKRQIDQFFDQDGLKDYRGSYGKSDSLTSNELSERNKVIALADDIYMGARNRGNNLALDDAMQLALDSLNVGKHTTAARQSVQDQLKQREAGISTRPTSQAPRVKEKPVKTRTDLERRVGPKLREAFNAG